MTEKLSYWRLEIAQRIIELIYEANRGTWPATLFQWRRVAQRFGLHLYCLRASRPFTPRIYDDFLIVPWLPAMRDTDHCLLVRWLTHELTEAILIWDGEPEYCYVTAETPNQARHRIARLVENLAVASL